MELGKPGVVHAFGYDPCHSKAYKLRPGGARHYCDDVVQKPGVEFIAAVWQDRASSLLIGMARLKRGWLVELSLIHI
eukprot:15229549-Alexandrium_andersonii.AAC.1